MAIELRIRKQTGNVWDHYKEKSGLTYGSSQLTISWQGDNVEVTELAGNDFARYNISEIAVHDDTDTGAEEVFATPTLMAQRLKALLYTGFKTTPGGSGVWGLIEGEIEDQDDLVQYIAENAGGGIPEATEPFTTVLKIDKNYTSTSVNEGVQNGVITFTIDDTNAKLGSEQIKEFVADGSDVIFGDSVAHKFGTIAGDIVDNVFTTEGGIKYRFGGKWDGSKLIGSIYEVNTVNYIPQLNAPVLLTLTQGSTSELNFTLTDTNTSPSESGIRMFYKKSADPDYIFEDFPANTTSGSITGLDNATEYSSYAKALGATGLTNDSENSNTLTQTTSDSSFDFVTSLVASYQFEDNVDDYTTNNDGTPTTITYQEGEVGQEAVFNGITSKVVIPDSDDFSFTDGSGTDNSASIAFWLNPDSIGTTQAVFSKYNGGTTAEWEVLIISGVLWIRFYSQGSLSTHIKTGISATASARTHYVFTYGGGNIETSLKVYENGVLGTNIPSEAGSYVQIDNSSSPLYIGQRYNGTLIFTGDLDEAKIYKNRVLTQVEITEMYTQENLGHSVL